MTEHQPMVINFNSIQKNSRDALMFSIFESLEIGASMIISNNETMEELKEKFEAVGLKNLELNTLENGPMEWLLLIKKIDEKTKSTGCCGVCGGH
ncbi:MAG: hypothetical protein WA160_10785 [Pseudobdellovibrio sp.]